MMLKLALSPCPNDTYLFCGLVLGRVPCALFVESQIADLDVLNQWALEGLPDVCKVSFATYARVKEHYDLLPVGAALGVKNGPKLIATQPLPADGLKSLSKMRLVLPGAATTAYALYRHLLPHGVEERHVPFHRIEASLLQGDGDAGVIIHESRFTFERAGLHEWADLGQLWYAQTGLPLPLGCLIAKKELSVEHRRIVVEALTASLAWARHPDHASDLWAFVEHHSQNKERAVMQAHIDMYVNAETEGLSEVGYRAIATLEALLPTH